MSRPDLQNVTYREMAYCFPTLALGGTPEAPRLKPTAELLLDWARETAPVVVHDDYGVLTTCLGGGGSQYFLSDKYTHHLRLAAALEANGLDLSAQTRFTPLDEVAPLPARAIMQVPKSLDLFELYLWCLTRRAAGVERIAAAFQTRHFSARMLEIAARYAGTVSQSRAYKKARLLYLDDLRAHEEPLPFREVVFRARTYRQYYGVFSAHHVDYATQFLLDEWDRKPVLRDLPVPRTILDIGCGNAVIGDRLLVRYPAADLVATDVSAVATASARYNVARAQVQWTDQVPAPPDPGYDLIVTNPPFHEGHRNTVDISRELFRQAAASLSPAGHLVVVANRHLNYATHLRRLFPTVLTVAESRKFVVYRC
ncbi:MAG: methyltransferase [Bacteroidota bacterium]